MHGEGFPYLPVLMFLPMAAAGLLAVLPGGRYHFRATSVNVGVLLLILALPMANRFTVGGAEPQFLFSLPLLGEGAFGVRMAVDGTSLPLVAVAILLLPVLVLASWTEIVSRVRRFHILVLLAVSFSIGVYASWDAGFLALCWIGHQVVLVIMLSGDGENGREAAVMAAAQAFCLMVGVFGLYMATGSLSLDTLSQGLPLAVQYPLFLAFALASFLSAAIFPLHAWMGSARQQASTAATILMASGSMPMGVYGLYRLCLRLTPAAAHQCSTIFILLAGAGAIYCGLMALGQDKVNRLMASVSACMASVAVLGMFLLNEDGVGGALFLNLHHMVVMPGLLVLLHAAVHMAGDDTVSGLGDVVSRSRIFAGLIGLFVLGIASVPGLSGFVGLVMVMAGAFGLNGWAGWILVPGPFLAGAALIRPFSRAIWSRPRAGTGDFGITSWAREVVCAAPLLFVLLWLGMAPHLVIEMVGTTVTHSPAMTIIARQTPAHPFPDMGAAPALRLEGREKHA